MAEPYRPSNGTEGDIFEARWCGRCERDAAFRRDINADGCPIAAAACAFGIDDPNYPAEWICDARGPRCTAFVPEGEIGRARVAHAEAVAAGQIDLFGVEHNGMPEARHG